MWKNRKFSLQLGLMTIHMIEVVLTKSTTEAGRTLID